MGATVVALFLLLLPFSSLGTRSFAREARRRLAGRPSRIAIAGGLLLVPYLIYGTGTGTLAPVPFLGLAIFVAAPTALIVWAARAGPAPRWQDFAAILSIWLPFEFGWMRGIWPWPRGAGSVLSVVLGVDLTVLLFVSFRGLDGVGYRFALRPRDGSTIAKTFGLFLAVGIPLGILTGFIAFNPRIPRPLHVLGTAVAAFLLTAMPEELLFRGLILNMLRRILERRWTALALSALVFGVAHLNNGPRPDWRYVLLATIAGLFYGRAYILAGGITAAAVVHALVDTVWSEMFR